jgi:hypothetical protein
LRPLTALRLVLLGIILNTAAFAGEITGTATNRTTQKPATGDDVILLKLSQGMQEAARTKVDAKGHFKLTTPDDSSTYLIRVTHGKVNYHRPAPPGTTSVEIDVYDAAEHLDEVSQSIDVMRLEADATTLRAVEGYSLNNLSRPPRTLMSPNSFEIVIPEGGKIEQAAAFGPGGMPITVAPVPAAQKNHYTFAFPIRPGETRFQIEYSLPYDGKATIRPQLLRATENFAVTVPKSMQLTPEPGSRLEARGDEAGLAVWVANRAAPGQPLGFTVSGTGTAPAEETPQAGGEAQPRNTPGGGIGTPINTPDPLTKYKWWIMAGLTVLLVAGAAWSLSRPEATAAPVVRGSLTDSLKDELFALESERLQNRISAEEYARAKSALDLLMQRALSRKA